MQETSAHVPTVERVQFGSALAPSASRKKPQPRTPSPTLTRGLASSVQPAASGRTVSACAHPDPSLSSSPTDSLASALPVPAARKYRGDRFHSLMRGETQRTLCSSARGRSSRCLPSLWRLAAALSSCSTDDSQCLLPLIAVLHFGLNAFSASGPFLICAAVVNARVGSVLFTCCRNNSHVASTQPPEGVRLNPPYVTSFT